MIMINELILIIQNVLVACFQAVNVIFSAIGLTWVYVVAAFALLSAVMRLYVRRFIGETWADAAPAIGDNVFGHGRYSASSRPSRYHGKFERRSGSRGNRVNWNGKSGVSTHGSARFSGSRGSGYGGYVIGNKGYKGRFSR